jgi:hypothetical protein
MTRMNLYGQLGDLLQRQRRPEEAAKWYRQCLESTDGEILPSAAWGYGTTLVTLGRAQDALAVAEEFRKRFVDSRSASLLVGRASPEQVEFIVGFFRRLANVEDRYEALAAGRKEPADEAELISLALMCYLRENYVASARFFGQVSPEVSGSGQMNALTRFYAGCAALAAGCGNGVEGGRLDVAERAEFRRVGRERLSTELKRMQALIEEDFAGYYLMAFGYAETLLRDQLFEFVRSPSSLRWLPEAERDEWNAFWSQVKALQEKAR